MEPRIKEPRIEEPRIERGERAEQAAASDGGPGRRTPLSRPLRLTAALVAAVPLCLMGVASQLDPSSRGFGTHRQLGLPPCSARALLGIPCPSCGMTTSWAHFVRGQWSSSLAVNPGGFLLALFSLTVSALSLRTCRLGRLPTAVTWHALFLGLLAIALVTLSNWVWTLMG